MSGLHKNGLPPAAARKDQANVFASGKQSFPASVAGSASVNIAPGVDPTAPVDGDAWVLGSSFKLKLDGTVKSVMFQGDTVPWSDIDVDAADLIATLGYTPGSTILSSDESLLLSYVM